MMVAENRTAGPKVNPEPWSGTPSRSGPVQSPIILPQNVTRSLDQPLESRLREFRSACGSEVFDQLLEANSEDLTLFEAASREVERRFLARPLSHEWLAEFRAKKYRLTYLQTHCLKAGFRTLVSRSRTISSAFERALNAFEPKPRSNGQHHLLAKGSEIVETRTRTPENV